MATGIDPGLTGGRSIRVIDPRRSAPREGAAKWHGEGAVRRSREAIGPGPIF
jgi:hypothetical protein